MAHILKLPLTVGFSHELNIYEIGIESGMPKRRIERRLDTGRQQACAQGFAELKTRQNTRTRMRYYEGMSKTKRNFLHGANARETTKDTTYADMALASHNITLTRHYTTLHSMRRNNQTKHDRRGPVRHMAHGHGKKTDDKTCHATP